MCFRTARQRREGVGLLFLGLVIVTWVAQSELAQFIQVGSYNKPFFLTWCNHVFAVLMLPVALLGFHTCVKPKADRRQRTVDRGFPGARCNNAFLGITSWPLFLARVFAVACVYQFADYAWYLGLPLVSVTTGTVLFNVSCVYTYLISLFCCLERHLSIYKVGGIALTMGGVLMVSGSQTDNNANNATSGSAGSAALLDTLGKVCILSGAFGYSVFEVAVSRLNAAADTVRHQKNRSAVGPNVHDAPKLSAPSPRRAETAHGVMVLTSVDPSSDCDESDNEKTPDPTIVRSRPAAAHATHVKCQTSGEFDDLDPSFGRESSFALLDDRVPASKPPLEKNAESSAEQPTSHRETDNAVTIVYSCFLTGMMGAVSLATLWPGIVAVNFAPNDTLIAEPFEWPSASNALLMLANGGLALGFNLFFMLALAFCKYEIVPKRLCAVSLLAFCCF
eukprot:INCI5374.3.p1 GENE.INCI5374.3~~INCI5374.3.p1  ORF type:complete len:449 (+),score=38.60 INCI5374.3:59-1405(+)